MYGPSPSSAEPEPHPDASSLHWALYYASRGWPVIPLHTVENGRCTCGDAKCGSPSKHPREPLGVKGASARSSQIQLWWQLWPGANVGIVTGVASGLLVLEIDPHNGGDASFEQLRKQYPGAFGEQLEAQTGCGTRQQFFRCKEAIGSRVNLLPGIDVKADGDFIAGPPSLDASGSCTRFVANSGLAPPQLPAALRELILRKASSSWHQRRNSGGVPPEPEPWPEPVDGALLLDEIIAVFERHLVLPEGAAEAMALWVLFTHAFDAAEVSPRLALLSPVPECGKTSAFSILSRLVRRALLASNVSAAVVFRVIERDRPTLLMDEAETYMEGREDYRGILNSGHTPDAAAVWRTVGPNHLPKRFSTWAPIAVAKIGKLPATLASRSIIIPMHRKRPDERVERLRPRRDGPALDELARKCARWATDNLPILESADPAPPDELNNRAADNWRPFLAIADAAGGDWPDRTRRAALVLEDNEAETTPGEELLADIHQIFIRDSSSDRIASHELCNELAKIEGRSWANFNNGFSLSPIQLAAMLRPFHIMPKSIRIGPKTPKGYLLKDFENAFARYVSEKRKGPTSE